MEDLSIKELRRLLTLSSPGPWEHDCDDNDPEGVIPTEDGCGVAIIHHHGNIGTVTRTGQEFSHDDARFIVEARNNMEGLLERVEKHKELFDLCKKFINDRQILCAESVYLNDYITEHAYDFIKDICDIVGYFDEERGLK